MSSHRNDGPAPARRHAGVTLIELLVAMAIGLIVTLAVTIVLMRSEGSKRSTTSVNDLNQTGTYVAYVLDRAVRSAGSGFSQSWSNAYGCLLKVTKSSQQVLPLPPAMNASSAFAGLGSSGTVQMRLAPVIIARGLADSGSSVRGDVLVTMAGAAGIGEAGYPVSATTLAAGATSVPMKNAIGFGTDDLVLLVDPAVTSGCQMQQVGTRTRKDSGTALPLAGAYYIGSGMAGFGASTTALQLGNAGTTSAATTNLPQFQLYGVGDNNTLVAYDLMQPNPGATMMDLPVADGVVEMRALYGLDTTSPPDGVIDAWAAPTATDPSGDYSAATLTNGSAASQTKLRRIVAVRIGLILRTSLAEKPGDYQQAAGTTLTLFSGVTDSSGATLAQTRALATTDLTYRFRTVEITVPIRNTLLAPTS